MIFKNMSFSIITSFVKMLTSLWLFSLISNGYSPVEYAPYGAVIVLIGLFTTVGGIGFAPAVVQIKELTQDKFSVFYTFTLCIGLLLSFIVIIFSDVISKSFNLVDGTKFFLLSSPLIAIKLQSLLLESLLQRNMKIIGIIKTDFMTYMIFHFIMQAIFMYYKLSVDFLIVALVLEEIAKLIIYKCLSGIPCKLNFNFGLISDDMKFSLSVSVNRILNYFNSQCDKIFVSNKIGSVDFAGYSRVFQFSSYPITILGQGLDRIIYPYICQKYRNGIRVNHFIFVLILLFIGICGVFFCYSIDDFVLKYFLKNEWSQYISIYYIVVFLIPIRLVDRYCSIALNSIGAPRHRTISQVAFLVVLVSGLYLVPTDIRKVAIVSIISYCSSVLFSLFFLYKNMRDV